MNAIQTTTLREQMRQHLQLAGLSERTQEAYLLAGLQKVRHYGFASPNSQQPFEAVRWLVTLHAGLLFVLATHQMLVSIARPPLRCASAAGHCASSASRAVMHRTSTRVDPCPPPTTNHTAPSRFRIAGIRSRYAPC